eukprot:7658364-Pyramimonas_sp.AAC.1
MAKQVSYRHGTCQGHLVRRIRSPMRVDSGSGAGVAGQEWPAKAAAELQRYGRRSLLIEADQ